MTAPCGRRATLLSTALVGVYALFAFGCGNQQNAEVVAGLDACVECQMVIDQPRQAAGYFVGGSFVTFDSPICLLRSYESLAQRGEKLPTSIHFAVDDSGQMQTAETTTFLLTQHRPTLMDAGVLAFSDPAAAEATRIADGELLVDWQGFRNARARPDRVIELRFGPEGMVPEVVSAARGELVEWSVRSSGLASDLALSIGGYPELAPILVPASGDEIVFRMRAVRPGAGFPIVATGVDEPFGMLKVIGPHTADEEAR